MNVMASGASDSINHVISSPLYAGLIVAAIVSIAGVVWRSVFQLRRLGWSSLYDEPINQGSPTAVPALPSSDRGESGKSSLPPDGWGIQVQEESGPDAPKYTVRNGSLVVLEIRNIGRLTIREADFGTDQFFRVRFPGRKVIHYKVRDNPLYHDRVHKRDNPAPPIQPGAGNVLNLPALHLRPGKGFKLLVLLESETETPPERYEKPVVEGDFDGSVAEYGWYRRGRRYVVAALAVLFLAFGGWGGASIANSAQDPAPGCASGSLTIAGSTAFAPVFTQVVTEYEQHCPDAHITVVPDGSIQGLADLEKGNANIAMYDGAPEGAVPSQYVPRKVGDVIFAVVGNNSLPRSYFETGLTSTQIAQIFNDPKAGEFTAVGRASISGTRQAFVNDVLPEGDTDAAEKKAPHCPVILDGAVGTVCLEDTTLQLLDYINGTTTKAIGYAEADALPFFPNVREIPINGYEPTRGNVLNGDYNFLATERLYTNGPASGLAEAIIDFLMSPQVTAQLRGASSFIGCSDLSGQAHGGDCQG